jgi:hypothetical protein
MGIKVYPLLDKLKDTTFAKYVPALQNLTIIRSLQQLGSVFKTVKLDKIRKLAHSSFSDETVERLIMDTVKVGLISARLDHRNGLLQFLDENFESQRTRSQLAVLTDKLSALSETIHGYDMKHKKKERENVYKQVRDGLEREQQAVFERKEIIEKRKIEREEQRALEDKQKEEQRALEDKQRQEQIRQKMQEDAAKRESEQKKRQQEEQDLITKKSMAAQLMKKAEEAKNQGVGVKKITLEVGKIVDNLSSLDKNAITKAAEEVSFLPPLFTPLSSVLSVAVLVVLIVALFSPALWFSVSLFFSLSWLNVNVRNVRNASKTIGSVWTISLVPSVWKKALLSSSFSNRKPRKKQRLRRRDSSRLHKSTRPSMTRTSKRRSVSVAWFVSFLRLITPCSFVFTVLLLLRQTKERGIFHKAQLAKRQTLFQQAQAAQQQRMAAKRQEILQRKQEERKEQLAREEEERKRREEEEVCVRSLCRLRARS